MFHRWLAVYIRLKEIKLVLWWERAGGWQLIREFGDCLWVVEVLEFFFSCLEIGMFVLFCWGIKVLLDNSNSFVENSFACWFKFLVISYGCWFKFCNLLCFAEFDVWRTTEVFSWQLSIYLYIHLTLEIFNRLLFLMDLSNFSLTISLSRRYIFLYFSSSKKIFHPLEFISIIL